MFLPRSKVHILLMCIFLLYAFIPCEASGSSAAFFSADDSDEPQQNSVFFTLLYEYPLSVSSYSISSLIEHSDDGNAGSENSVWTSMPADADDNSNFNPDTVPLSEDGEFSDTPLDPSDKRFNYVVLIILIALILLVLIIILLINRRELKRTQSSLYETLSSLKTRDEQLMLALENADEGLWEWDTIHDSISVNPEWTVQYPYLSPIMPSKEWILHMHPDDQELFSAEQVLSSIRSSGDHIFRMKNNMGEFQWLAIRGKRNPGEEKQQTNITGTITDITNVQRYEQSLIEANKKLNLLLQVTRHDLLNQLMVLTSVHEMMFDSERSPEEIELLEMNDEALSAIRRQIEFTRAYQNLGEKGAQWQDVSYIIHILKDLLVRPPIRLEMSELPEIYADSLFEKVVYNLIENAIRHGGNKMTQISVTFEQEKCNGVLIFEDNGIGIPDEKKETIFERGDVPHKYIGLFMVREILSITDISIRETGISGSGARFELIIPNSCWRIPYNTHNC